jgi:DNA (cytosine-5)-methyltransferase 1
MGRGRFVHPEERRTLTPREAARIQFIPDFFDFSAAATSSRRELVEMIGNAVPPKLAYVFALELLR